MKSAETTLPNGLRAIAIGRPGTATVASQVFLKAGSRHDGDRHGIGHCLEHARFRTWRAGGARPGREAHLEPSP